MGYLNPESYFYSVRLDTVQANVNGFLPQASATTLSQLADAVHSGGRASWESASGERFRVTRAHPYPGYRLRFCSDVDNTLVYTFRINPDQTPRLHVVFQPSYCWTHGPSAYQERLERIASDFCIESPVIEPSRIDFCCDVATPTHLFTKGRRTGTHNSGKKANIKSYYDFGPGQPMTGLYLPLGEKGFGFYAKSQRERTRKVGNRRFFPSVWNAYAASGYRGISHRAAGKAEKPR